MEKQSNCAELPQDILGDWIYLSEGRVVFVGRKEGDTGIYLIFKNNSRQETLIKLTAEALASMLLLIPRVIDPAGPRKIYPAFAKP